VPDNRDFCVTGGAKIHKRDRPSVPRLTNPQLPGERAARWRAIACRILADDPAANTCGLAVTGRVRFRGICIRLQIP
jgi:hypothetical protein